MEGKYAPPRVKIPDQTPGSLGLTWCKDNVDITIFRDIIQGVHQKNVGIWSGLYMPHICVATARISTIRNKQDAAHSRIVFFLQNCQAINSIKGNINVIQVHIKSKPTTFLMDTLYRGGQGWFRTCPPFSPVQLNHGVLGQFVPSRLSAFLLCMYLHSVQLVFVLYMVDTPAI